MNAKDAQNKRLEELLRKAHLSEPSPQLQERVAAAAKSAWNQAPLELPWLIPIRRLAASAVAAVVIIGLANFVSDCALARWRAGGALAVNQQASSTEALPEMFYGPLARRLVCLNRQSSEIDASALNSHVEMLRHVLDESQQSEFASPPVPAGGRSRLTPNPSSDNSYS
jgi:hypothetical protein